MRPRRSLAPSRRGRRSRLPTFSAPTTASSITIASRDREARERDRVEGLAEQVEHERRRDQRDRDRHERDQRPCATGTGTPRAPARAGRRDHDRERQVVDRVLDEARRPEARTCRSAAPRAAGSACRARPRRPSSPRACSRRGTSRRRACRPSLVVDDRVADQRLVVLDPTFDTSVRRSRPPRALDRHLAELRRVGDLVEHVADLQPLLRRLDEAAGARRRAPRGSSAARRPARCRWSR